MARVYIDSHMFAEEWFGPILEEMIACKKVSFSYCQNDKFSKEIGKVHSALRFYQRISNMKDENRKSRRVEACKVSVDSEQALLKSSHTFSSCQSCDDEHIFALNAVQPTPFIFSKDKRMAKCRREVKRKLHRKYSKFSVVSNKKVYGTLRLRILR